MLRCHPFRSIRHGHVIRHKPTSICGYRQIVSAAGERRRNRRRRGNQPRTSNEQIAASQDSAILSLGKSTQQPTDHPSDLKFDPFPPMTFTARPPYLGTAEAQDNDAHRHNTERGRSLISRYGSVESALRALDVAYLHI